jgi:hypothetical protein
MKFVQSLYGDAGLTCSDPFCFVFLVNLSDLFNFSYGKGARIHSNSWGDMQYVCVADMQEHMRV